MQKGNSLIGIISRNNYLSMWAYPLGFQVVALNDLVSISLVISRLEISFSFKKNYNLFLK